MSASDTPRADAVPLWHGEPAVNIDFARQLERELTAANEKLATMQRECFSSVCRDLRYQLDQATARADLWRARCKEAQKHLAIYITIWEQDGWDVEPEELYARDAGKDE